jgi:hypothetical protein
MQRLAPLVALAVALLIRPVESLAETRQFCEQTVAYTITPPDSGMASTLRAFSGVWSGAVVFQPAVEMCVALIVENIRPNGEMQTKFVWLAGTSTGIGNLASLGAVAWSGKVEGDVLRLVGSKNGSTYAYEFGPSGINEMRGWFLHNNHRTPLVLKRI